MTKAEIIAGLKKTLKELSGMALQKEQKEVLQGAVEFINAITDCENCFHYNRTLKTCKKDVCYIAVMVSRKRRKVYESSINTSDT